MMITNILGFNLGLIVVIEKRDNASLKLKECWERGLNSVKRNEKGRNRKEGEKRYVATCSDDELKNGEVKWDPSKVY